MVMTNHLEAPTKVIISVTVMSLLTSRWTPYPEGTWTGYLAVHPQRYAVHWYWSGDRNTTACEVPLECQQICPVVDSKQTDLDTTSQTLYAHKTFGTVSQKNQEYSKLVQALTVVHRDVHYLQTV